MIMTIYDPENKGKSRFYRFLLKLMTQGYMPVLLLGEKSFSFYHFLRLGKIHHIPFTATGNLLSVSAVNMYHIEEIIADIYRKISQEIPNAVPVFFDFTAHYIDENVPAKTADSLFQRDLSEITRIALETDRPALFIESSKVKTVTRQTDYRSILYHRSSLYFDYSKRKITKENLRLEEKQKIYKNSDSKIFYLCGKFIKQMETISQITISERYNLFEQVLPSNTLQHTSKPLQQSIRNGNKDYLQ